MKSKQKYTGGKLQVRMPKEPVANHNWQFNQMIMLHDGPSETLRDTLSDEMLEVIDLSQAEIVFSRTNAPNHSLQDSDAVIRVPPLGSSGRVQFRVLVEAKNEIRINDLMPQLKRYESGLYLRSNEPVVMLLLNVGAKWKGGDVMEFRDWLANPGDQFWDVYDEYVSKTKIRVVSLQDPETQQRLLESVTACSIGLYAMSVALGPVTEQMLANIMTKAQRLEDQNVQHAVLMPTMKYLNSYEKTLKMSIWRDIEIKQTGNSKMVDATLGIAEMYREEGREEGRQELMQATAGKMLHNGIDRAFVREYFELSDEQIDRLIEGHSADR